MPALLINWQSCLALCPELAGQSNKTNIMQKINLEKRLTHRFTTGWSALDEHEEIGTARVLAQKEAGRDDENKRAFLLLLVHSQSSPEDIKSAIRDTMTNGCRCEHDCCGHWQHGVSKVRRLKNGKLYAVKTYAYRNC